ncbi:MAG: ABC-type transport system involved in Fe-S cluster assembly fused permease/ATPase subunit [Alphaproteobacteria bacterium]|jgi:ABC-type transport system involved in Fe-S cluster assembly fused permease/ATPase subunit
MTTAGRTLSGRKTDGGFEWGVLRNLGRYLWPADVAEMKVRVVAALSCLALAKLANVTVPVLYRDAVDLLVGEVGTIVALPLGLLIAYGLVRVMTIAFAEFRDAIFAKVGQRAIRTVALSAFRHLHALSLRFHLERQTGGLTRAIERGTKAIDLFLNFMLFNILPTLLEITMVCGILWAMFNFWFGLVTFLTVTSYIAFTVTVTEWRIKFRRQMNETDQQANTRAIDSLLNYETVKYFGNEEHEALRFDSALANYERAAVLNKTSLSFLNVGQAGIIGGGLTLMMVLAANGVVAGEMTIGDFVLVNTYLIQLFQPLNFLGYAYREIKQALIDMEAMFNLLEINQEVADDDNALPLPEGPGVVKFEDVCFAYDPRREILQGISFNIPAGHKLAIVGSSGAGKSTIARLMFRFYDASAGSIRIDGQDIRRVTQKSVRAAIGVVPQDTVLFNDTIYYNIAYGRPGASAAEIEAAARLSSIHDFIVDLPDGYDTMVGERGLKLSGGEKQRVAIARTILKNPRILIFDEATSALDTHTEREIQAALRKVSADHTTLVIAHRLSTVVDADEIIVLEQGKIVERGRHDDLLARNHLYAAMWRRQQDGDGEALSANADSESAEPV